MRILRTLVLAAAAALPLAAPALDMTPARASGPMAHQFVVYWRHSPNESWMLAPYRYTTRIAAENYARNLERRYAVETYIARR